MEVGACALCRETRELVKSHIIPQAFHKPMLENGESTFFSMSTNPVVKNKRRAKQLKERMLCVACERLIKKYEDHAIPVVKKLWEVKFPPNTANQLVENVDYGLFRLFELSILWRASVARQAIFRAVDLGPHEERIRQMLLAAAPGEPTLYPCSPVLVYFNEPSYAGPVHMIGEPEKVRLNSVLCYRFLFGSCVWIYYVSLHFDIKEAGGHRCVVQQDGRITIPIRDVRDVRFLSRYLLEMSDKAG